MPRVVQCLLAGILVLSPAQALASPAEDASAVIDRWAAAFNANDADAVVKLYAPDGLLHGTSCPTLNAGTSAISEYFKVLPGSGNKVTLVTDTWSPSVTPPRWASDSYEFKSAQGRDAAGALHIRHDQAWT